MNTVGSFLKLNLAGFGEVFRCNTVSFLGGFSYKDVVTSTIEAELLVVIEVVHVA